MARPSASDYHLSSGLQTSHGYSHVGGKLVTDGTGQRLEWIIGAIRGVWAQYRIKNDMSLDVLSLPVNMRGTPAGRDEGVIRRPTGNIGERPDRVLRRAMEIQAAIEDLACPSNFICVLKSR